MDEKFIIDTINDYEKIKKEILSIFDKVYGTSLRYYEVELNISDPLPNSLYCEIKLDYKHDYEPDYHRLSIPYEIMFNDEATDKFAAEQKEILKQIEERKKELERKQRAKDKISEAKSYINSAIRFDPEAEREIDEFVRSFKKID